MKKYNINIQLLQEFLTDENKNFNMDVKLYSTESL